MRLEFALFIIPLPYSDSSSDRPQGLWAIFTLKYQESSILPVGYWVGKRQRDQSREHGIYWGLYILTGAIRNPVSMLWPECQAGKRVKSLRSLVTRGQSRVNMIGQGYSQSWDQPIRGQYWPAADQWEGCIMLGSRALYDRKIINPWILLSCAQSEVTRAPLAKKRTDPRLI